MENLITLQKSYEINEDIKKRIEYLKNYPKVVEIKENVKKIKSTEQIVKEKLDCYREELKDQEKELKYQEDMIKEIVKELYSGKINDLKILENLNKKEKKVSDEKQIIENKVIEIMGKIDIQMREMNKVKYKSNLLEEKLEKMEIQIEEKITDYEKKLVKINKKIEFTRKNTNMELLKKHDEIRKRYENALVKVIDEMCTGCNLQVFLNTMNLVMKKELVECEHCRRLLYIEEN